MWEELASHKNHFLQRQFPKMKKTEINGLVESEFERNHNSKCWPPKRVCYHSTYLDDHTQLAYGWFALPKLMRELASYNEIIRWRAVNTLSEFLLNPLYAQRAITEMDIVRKLNNYFMFMRKTDNVYKTREIRRILYIFHQLSNYQNGADKMIHRKYLIPEFYKMMKKEEAPYLQILPRIFRNLTEKSEVVLYLLEHTPSLQKTAEIFLQDKCKPDIHYDFWMHLCHMIEIAPERGIDAGLFEFLHYRIIHKIPDYFLMNMKAFAMLLRCEEGQLRFDKVDGIPMLHHILVTERDNIPNYEYVVLALMNSLLSKRAMWRAREFTNLPDVVVLLAKETSNPNLQSHCLQTIRELSEMPCIKRYICAALFQDLKKLHCWNETNHCYRDELIGWLTSDPYYVDYELLKAIRLEKLNETKQKLERRCQGSNSS